MDIKDDKVIARITAADPNSDFCDEGVWLEVQADDGTRPTLCLVKSKGNSPIGWYLGAYRDAKKPAIGCDFAISFGSDGPILQVVKGKEVKSINLFDLLEKIGA